MVEMGLEERTSSGERTWCGEGIKCFNNEPMDNGFGPRQLSSSSKVKVQDGGKASTKQDSEELEVVISNGSFKESKPQTTTEMCQNVFFEVTEKFTSLCKLLFDNFQGIKLDSLFHLSLINSRMKYGAYEQSPMVFSSDIQQIGCSGVDVEEEKREVPSFPNDIAMEILWLSKCRGLLFLRQ
ncbi:hypothetical protein V6N11_077281 [Hibiscus sabdariffa]|uniref:Uncharacterized protein n=1 Tax=Hibiscus sabdariffa TaxID=183260 RepID=A0ABR2TCQ5_9ROSI